MQQQRFCLNFENASTAADLPSERDFYRWAWAALKSEYRRADISLILLDEEEARAYNRDYRGKDYATNVLSFALNEGEILPDQVSDDLCGDLIICPQVVLKEAAPDGLRSHRRDRGRRNGGTRNPPDAGGRLSQPLPRGRILKWTTPGRNRHFLNV